MVTFERLYPWSAVTSASSVRIIETRKTLDQEGRVLYQTLQRLALVIALTLPSSITIAQERRIVPEPALAMDFGTSVAINSAFVAVLTRQWRDKFPPSRLQVFRRDDVAEPVLDRSVPIAYIHKVVMSEDVLAVGIQTIGVETHFLLYRRIGARWYPAQSIPGEHVGLDGLSVVAAACDAAEATGCRIRTYSLSGATPVLEDEFSRPAVSAVALSGGTLYVSEAERDSATGHKTQQIHSYTRALTGRWEPQGLIRPGAPRDGFDYGNLLVASENALVIESAGYSINDGTGNVVILDVANAPRVKNGTSRTFVHSSTDPEFLIRMEDEQSKAVLAGSNIFVLRDGNLDHFLLDGTAAPESYPSIAARLKKEGRRPTAVAGTSNGLAIVVEKPGSSEREVWVESLGIPTR